MSNNDGRLTDKERDKFVAWLNGKGKSHKCPVCEENDWGIGPNFIQGLIYHPNGGVSIGGPSYPQAFIVCNNCAYTRTFMAVQIGLVENEGEEGEEDEQNKRQ